MLDFPGTRPAPCPLCGRNDGSVDLPAISRGDKICIMRCGCGHRYLADWTRHYSETLYAYYGEDDWRAAHVDSPITIGRYRTLLRRLGRLVEGRDVLDIGCGAGEFVATAIGEGWDARGVELSEAAVAFCTARGLPVRRSDIFASNLEPGSVSVCTLFEVIEHVPDPRAFLARAVELTRPGGLIYLTTPNIASLDARILRGDWNALHVEHISYFTPKTLLAMIERSGLEAIELSTRNLAGATLRRLIGQRTAPVDVSSESELRETVEGSAILRVAKAVVNGVLGFTGRGSAMTALCRRPA